MAVVLRSRDRFGRDVVLTRRCWSDHVLRRRPYFAGQERIVAQALTSPTFVNHDVDYRDRECFYVPSPLPYPYGGLWVKVVVAYTPAIALGRAAGTVVTVHLTDKEKPGEVRKWP